MCYGEARIFDSGDRFYPQNGALDVPQPCLLGKHEGRLTHNNGAGRVETQLALTDRLFSEAQQSQLATSTNLSNTPGLMYG